MIVYQQIDVKLVLYKIHVRSSSSTSPDTAARKYSCLRPPSASRSCARNAVAIADTGVFQTKRCFLSSPPLLLLLLLLMQRLLPPSSIDLGFGLVRSTPIESETLCGSRFVVSSILRLQTEAGREKEKKQAKYEHGNMHVKPRVATKSALSTFGRPKHHQEW